MHVLRRDFWRDYTVVRGMDLVQIFLSIANIRLVMISNFLIGTYLLEQTGSIFENMRLRPTLIAHFLLTAVNPWATPRSRVRAAFVRAWVRRSGLRARRSFPCALHSNSVHI